jgi:hypothetical protein
MCYKFPSACIRLYIKTQYGSSSTYNGHMQPDPFLGTGQGAGDSMARWGFLSDALIRAYNKIAPSHPIRSPLSNLHVLEHIQAFVDDSHGLIVKSPSDTRSIDELIKHNLQAWEHLLHTVGGKLEITKCRFSKLEWTSNSKGVYTLNQQNMDNDPISITDHETNRAQEISTLSPSDSYKLLGVNMALDGNCIDQAHLIQSKCNKLARAFTRCKLTPEETTQGYFSIFLPAVKYGLDATSIPTPLLQKAQSIASRIILPKLGYNRHLPLPIVYAPTHFGGIGLQDLSTEQGLMHTTFLISHLRANSDVAKTLIILLETYMLVAGTIRSPLQDTKECSYINPRG